MTTGPETENFRERWRLWLLTHNRRGTRTLLWIVLALYPAFGVLDYLLAPRSAWPVLWGTRAVVTLATLIMFALVGQPLYGRWGDVLSAGYMLVCALGISIMTIFLGGLASPYYAGLTLAIVATGLLFAWKPRLVLVTHASIVSSFIVPNLLLHGTSVSLTAVSNLFFLISTALIASVGQIVMFRGAREQVRSQITIEETKQGLEDAHQQLKQLDRLKSQFFANITHELRTPLTMILAPLESMLAGDFGPLTPTQRSYLEANRRNGIRLLKLINDLLDLAKLEEGFLRLRPERTDLRALLEDVLAYARPLAARKEPQARAARSSRPPPNLHVDVEKIERVLVNLISNALKFTDEGGVTVTLDGGGRARCGSRSRTPGIGIAARVRRAGSSSASTRGTPRSPGATAAPASGWPTPRRSSSCTAGSITVEQHAGQGQPLRGASARGGPHPRGGRASGG